MMTLSPGAVPDTWVPSARAFIMMYAGVKDVRVLNGGLLSWENAGYEITSKKPIPYTAEQFGVKIPANPHLAVDIPEAKQILKSPEAELV